MTNDNLPVTSLWTDLARRADIELSPDQHAQLSRYLDLLFEAYLLRRTGADWSDELGRIRRWLQAA